MKQLYSKLYLDSNTQYRYNKESVGIDKLSHFVSMKGSKYDDQSMRLFVVGRAVNGWLQLPCDDADTFGKAADRAFHEVGFSWITSDETGLHNIPENGENTYYLSGSPFWRVAHRVWQSLSGFDCERWVDNIAWSNLYKIAPAKTGNPTVAMCKRQLTACQEILKHELEFYKPTHILVITGWRGWFCDDVYNFSNLFSNCRYIGSNSEDRAIYVEGVAQFALMDGTSVPAIITCRPEFRNEDLFVEQSLQAFRDPTLFNPTRSF